MTATDPLELAPPGAAEACGCPEYGGLSRRGLFRAGAVVAGAGAATATFGSTVMQTAFAATRTAPATVVVVSLRGAADGLSLVVPHADPNYYEARPRLAIPKGALVATDPQFGLHPALSPLLPLWQQGRMAAIPAVGLPAPNRSHFAAMEEIEDADPGSSARIGWLNRLIGRDDYAHPLRAIELGSSVPPTALVGPTPAFAAQSVADVELAGADGSALGRRRPRALETIWGNAPGALGRGVRATLSAVDDFDPVHATAAKPRNGASYPDKSLGQALASAARTIRGDVGAEVITIDHGGWDMHSAAGNLEWGQMGANTDTLARSLAAFFTDLGGLASKVTVVTVSEFGRRVRENDSWGTDHGYGTVMFALGAGVRGGYHGTWPGVENTLDADVTVTTDFRSVLSEMVVSRFGASSAAVFPRFTPETVGVF